MANAHCGDHYADKTDNIQKLLQGFSGTLVSDAFSGYKSLYQNNEKIRAAFCWAHARRDYADAPKALTELAWELACKTIAHQAPFQIAHIYKAEEALRDLNSEKRQTRQSRQTLVQHLKALSIKNYGPMKNIVRRREIQQSIIRYTIA